VSVEQSEPPEGHQPRLSPDDFMRDVRHLVTYFYDSVNRVSSLAARSNIPTSGLNLTGAVSDAVDSLLNEARKRRRLYELIVVINTDYGNDRPEIAVLVDQAAEFVPPVSAGRVSGSFLSPQSQENPVLAKRTIQRSADAVPENVEDRSFQALGDIMQDLNHCLESLHVHLDLLRVSQRIYGVASDLAWQSWRLQQVTDLPEGTTSLRVQAYRDTLGAVIDAQAELENLDLDELLGRIAPAPMSDKLLTLYKAGLRANRARIERLKYTEGDAGKAYKLAYKSAWKTRELRVFWSSILQQLYLSFADRLGEMRQALTGLPWWIHWIG
jgi:hypothetical protein